MKEAALLLLCALARADCFLPGPARDGCQSDAAYFSAGTALYTDPAMGPGLSVLRYAVSFSVSLPASPGFYKVTVTAVEPNKTGAGQRLYTITANGVPSSALDLWANAGTLGTTKVILLAVSNGVIQMLFKAMAGNALYNRIDVEYATLFDVFYQPLSRF